MLGGGSYELLVQFLPNRYVVIELRIRKCLIMYIYIDYHVAIDLSDVGTLLCTSPCSYDIVT